MTDDPDPILEAASALRAKGHSIEPTGDFERWTINGREATDTELWVLATRLGLMDGTDRLQ